LITDSQLNGYSERFLDFVKNSSETEYINLQSLANLVRNDHMIQLYFSKLTVYDVVRVIYYTHFLGNGKKQDDIFILLDRIFVIVAEEYDEKEYLEQECDDCYGDGYLECSECEGSGSQTCRTCDGDRTVDCNECSGEGTEECYYCDGKGTETEEDDEGDEVEVDCTHCDGNGTEECSNCSGVGNFECPDCDGGGTESCRECDGGGTEYCSTCDGSGQVQSDEEYYTITKRRMVTVGNKVEKYDGECMLLKKFEKKDANNGMLINEFTISQSSYDDDVPEDERNSSVGMDDYFVEIVDVLKLERVNERLRF
jgi:hypothetical protein